MYSSHKANKTLILEPRRTFSSKQLTWAPGSKYMYVFIQEVIPLLQALSRASPIGMEELLSDYSLTVADPSFWLWSERVRTAAGVKGWQKHFMPTEMIDYELCKLWIKLSCKHAFPQVGADPVPGQPHSRRPGEGVPLIVYLIWVIHHKFPNCYCLKAVLPIKH